ncbi:unnamed protein product [Choristocarpus tenellus]
MTLKEGDKLPMDTTFQTLVDGKPTDMGASELFAGKKVVICGVPGAFTPTCNDGHLPSFINNVDAFKAGYGHFSGKGVDTVACVAVNDAFVMGSWIKSLDAADKVTMLSDGGGAFARATGLAVDTGNFGGVRLNRMSMVVDDGVVTKLNLEEKTNFSDISSGETVLGQL